MNTGDINIKKLEELNQAHSNKTNSRLRNVGGYLLNKFTKTKSKSTNLTSTVSNQKKRKNFFSLFEREPKVAATNTSPIKQIDESKQQIDSFNIFASSEIILISNESLLSSANSLDNSMAKSKIQAASKRRCNPPRLSTKSQPIPIETISQSFISDLKLDESKTKSNESLDKIMTKAARNMNRKTLTPSSPTNKIIESIIKISNELNLDQEKTLSSETNCIQKSTSCSSDFLTRLIDSSPNETNLHIYDNSTPLYNYNTSTSDTSINETISKSEDNSKKLKLFAYKSNESNLNIEATTTSSSKPTNKISELKTKFNTNSSGSSSKSFEALDRIQRQLSEQPPRIEIVNSENDQLNRKLITYSKSLKLNSTKTSKTDINLTNELVKPNKRVSSIIHDLNSSNEPVRVNLVNRQQSHHLEQESKMLEKGKVKLIVKGLEK